MIASRITSGARRLWCLQPPSFRCYRYNSLRVRPVAAIGPEPPPTSRGNKPSWVRILEEDADVDEDVAELLQGAGGDPDLIRSRIETKLQQRELFTERSGSDTPPAVLFREVDQFDLWVWLELVSPLTATERDMLSSALKSWFVIGKLGGYNSQNMQVYHNSAGDLSYLDYDNSELQGGSGGGSLGAYMHEMGDPEYNGTMARFRCDLGTADEVAVDILVNLLAGFSRDVAGIRRITFGGGQLNGWAVPEEGQEERRPPKVGIDPMRLPEGLDDEMVLLDELDAMQSDINEHRRANEARAAAGGGGGRDAAQGGALEALARARPGGPLGGAREPSGAGWSRRPAPAPAAPAPAGPRQEQEQQQQQEEGPPPSVPSTRRRRAQRAAGVGGAAAAGGPGTAPARPAKGAEGMSFYSEDDFKLAFPNRGG